MPLGGARGQSLPILDWVFTNEHIWLWKFLGEKKNEIKLKRKVIH